MSIVGSSNAACAAEATLIAPSGIRAAVQQMIPDSSRRPGTRYLAPGCGGVQGARDATGSLSGFSRNPLAFNHVHDRDHDFDQHSEASDMEMRNDDRAPRWYTISYC